MLRDKLKQSVEDKFESNQYLIFLLIRCASQRLEIVSKIRVNFCEHSVLHVDTFFLRLWSGL